MFSQKVVDSLSKSSWIRAMFEQGEKLRKIHGPDKVYDFSIGNPDIEPPLKVRQVLKELVESDKPGLHRYMSNAGHADVRQKIAEHVSRESGLEVPFNNIVMTVGAAGGLNVVLKSILNPDEEVIVLAPFFVEYLYYIENFGGRPVIVKTLPSSFEPDIAAIEKSITSATKAIILNSPNNPTGVIYSEEILKKLADLLEQKGKELGTEIYVISDEPYAKIVYDDMKVPSVLKIFKNAIVVNSFSKSLALPGERIGYIAASPNIEDVDILINAMIFANRTLGFVNAPSLIQKVVAESLEEAVDIESYKKKRDVLYDKLISLGFTCTKPQGAFYLFPKAPIDDDIEFVNQALKYNLLLVPGSGFGYPGYVRLSYCISMDIIKNSFPAFEALAREYFK